MRSHFSSAARREISSTGSPTARCPATVKPFFLSWAMPSFSTSWARFFSSSSSSSGRKPSVRNMLEGIPATARRCVSDLANDAISAQASSADLPSWDPLYASRIFLNMTASFPGSSALFCQQSQPLDQRPLLLQGLAGVAGVVLARPVPRLLVELLQHLEVLGILERLLESVVQDPHGPRIYASRADDPIGRSRDDIEAQIPRGGNARPAFGALGTERDQQPELPGVDEAAPAARVRLCHDVTAHEGLRRIGVALEGDVQ